MDDQATSAGKGQEHKGKEDRAGDRLRDPISQLCLVKARHLSRRVTLLPWEAQIQIKTEENISDPQDWKGLLVNLI